MASTNGLGVQCNCPAWFVLGLRWSPYPAISQTTNQKIIGPQVSWDHAQAKEDIHLILWIDALYKQERPTTLSIYFRCLEPEELEEVAIETGYKSCRVCMHALSETFQEQQVVICGQFSWQKTCRMLFVLQLTLLHTLQCEARIFIAPPKSLTSHFTYCHFVNKKKPHLFITLHVLF